MRFRFANRVVQSDPIAPLVWAESNLSAIAKLTRGKFNGTDDDTVQLAATFGLLRARQQIRAARREVELIGRATA